MIRNELKTAATKLPVAFQDLLASLSAGNETDEQRFNSLIKSAVEYINQYSGKNLVNTTYIQHHDLNDLIYIVKGEYIKYPESEWLNYYYSVLYGHDVEFVLNETPLSSITEVRYYTDDNTPTTIASSNYFLNKGKDSVIFDSVFMSTLDLRTKNCFEIEYVAGYGSDSTAIPNDLKEIIYDLVRYVWERRRTSVNVLTVDPDYLTFLNNRLRKYKTLAI